VRFDGWIAGLGTTSGTRLVIGHWRRSVFGPISDVMLEGPDGVRLLFAPSAEVARFIGDIYAFDDVAVVPVTIDRAPPMWMVNAGPLRVRFLVGSRAGWGWPLRMVPPPLARWRPWLRLVNRPARCAHPEVRMYGSAGGRREWYAAQDLHHIVAARSTLDGVDLGPLAPVDPPVRFGFGSTPRSPALVRITTLIELPVRGGR
jgi:hypothetical protein